MARNIRADDMVYLQNMATNVHPEGKIGPVIVVVSGKATILMNCGRLVRAVEHKCHLMQLVSALHWGPRHSVAKPGFYDTCSQIISKQDLRFWFHFSTGGQHNVYEYLKLKVSQIVHQVRRPGQASWPFHGPDPETITNCVVWADGPHCQETPLCIPSGRERWSPCTVILRAHDDSDLKSSIAQLSRGRMRVLGMCTVAEFALRDTAVLFFVPQASFS